MRTIDADRFLEEVKLQTIEIDISNNENIQKLLLYEQNALMKCVFDTLNKQPTVGEWIPCSERLPEHFYDDCIITNIYGNVYGESRYDAKDECWKVVNRYVSAEEVVAWIPYPEPYKGDEDK